MLPDPSTNITVAPFPLFVARLAALPVRALESNTLGPLRECLTAYLRTLDALDAQRDRVSELLYEAVGRQSERTHRNALLRLRRDFFNGRQGQATDIALAMSAVGQPERDVLTAWGGLLSARDRCLDRLIQAYRTAIVDARAALQQQLNAPAFRNGLLLSSATLFANLHRYQTTPPHAFDARTNQLERGLLRYFTRSARKATPYASFCTIVKGELTSRAPHRGHAETFRLVGNPTRQVGAVRLDRRLYVALWTHLKTRPAVRAATPIDLNPTLRTDGNRWAFLATAEGKEIFQRLARHEAVDLVERVVRSGDAITLGELVQRLTADENVDATPAEATAFVDRLLSLGLLRFRAPVAEQIANWDVPLRTWLERIDDEHARLVARFLRDLSELTREFAVAGVDARAQLVDQIRDLCRRSLSAVDVPITVHLELPIYEDCSAESTLEMFIDPSLQDALDLLEDYLRLVVPYAQPRNAQATARHFFESHCPRDAALPLLDFYETYYREHLRERIELQALRQRGVRSGPVADYDFGNPFRLPWIDEGRNALEGVGMFFRTAWQAEPHAEEISISPQELRTPLGA